MAFGFTTDVPPDLAGGAAGTTVPAGVAFTPPDPGGGIDTTPAPPPPSTIGVAPPPSTDISTPGTIGGSNSNTETQSELQGLSLEIARAQLEGITAQTAQQQAGFDQISQLLSTLEAEAAQSAKSQQKLAPIIEETTQILLDNLRQGTKATPEQIAQIDAAIGAAQASGESDISAFAQDALTQLRETLAPALGLRPGDSPIIDRGGLVAREAARQQGQLTRGLAQTRAESVLNFPLAAQALQNQTAGFVGNLATQQQAFRVGLQQQAIQNRLGVQELFGNLGLGFAQLQPAGANLALGLGNQSTQLQLGQLAARSATDVANIRGPSAGGNNTGSTLGGVGGLLLGLGSIFA